MLRMATSMATQQRRNAHLRGKHTQRQRNPQGSHTQRQTHTQWSRSRDGSVATVRQHQHYSRASTSNMFTFQLCPKMASSRDFSHKFVHFKSSGIAFGRIGRFFRSPASTLRFACWTFQLEIFPSSLVVFYSSISSIGNHFPAADLDEGAGPFSGFQCISSNFGYFPTGTFSLKRRITMKTLSFPPPQPLPQGYILDLPLHSRDFPVPW